MTLSLVAARVVIPLIVGPMLAAPLVVALSPHFIDSLTVLLRRIGLRFFFGEELVIVVDYIVRLLVYMVAAFVFLHKLHPSASIDLQDMSLIVFSHLTHILFKLAIGSF